MDYASPSLSASCLGIQLGPRFRGRYGRSEGQIIPIKVTRGRIPMVLQLKVRKTVSTRQSMTFDATASPKAMRVRRGLLTGVTGR